LTQFVGSAICAHAAVTAMARASQTGDEDAAKQHDGRPHSGQWQERGGPGRQATEDEAPAES